MSVGLRHRIAATGYLLVLMTCAVVAFWPIYRDSDFVAMAIGALVAGAAVAVVGAIRRWSTLVTACVAAGAFLVLGVPLAVPGETMWRVAPTWQGFLDFLSALALSWRQLVTISVPVGSYQALLTPPYVLAFAGTLVSITVALRARMPELALVPPLAVFTMAIVLGSDTTATPLPLVVAIAALSVGWLAWMRRRRRVSRLVSLDSAHADGVRRGERSFAAARSVTVATVAVAVAVAAGVAVTTVLPTTAARTVARTTAMPPFNPRDYASPLSGFRSYLQPATAHRALFTVTGAGRLRTIRLATLDTYNGVVYSVGTQPGDSGAFARVPDTLALPDRDGDGAGRSIQTLEVSIDGLSGPWLPTFGDLQTISFGGDDPGALRDGFYYNSTTATMADIAAVRAGDSYSVTAQTTPSLTIAQLATAKPGDAALPAVSVMPDDLDDTVHRYEGDADTPGKKLSAVLLKLTQNGYISHGIGSEPTSLSGHGADRITSLLTDQPMIGDQEQYAVTAALMARRLGFPARVVLGFTVPQNGDNGSTTITGSDITAWIQVQTAKQGWVDVDPNPQVRPIPEKKPERPKQISRPQSVVDPPKDTSDRDQNPPPQSHVKQEKTDQLPLWLSILLTVLTVLGWTLSVSALVVAPFLAVIAAKWRRRRGRRSSRAGPRVRISGAWREFADSAVDHGYSPHASATRSEAAQAVGGPRSLLLASVADRSAFGRAEPTEADADQVWRAVEELRRDLDARTTRWGRLRARVSLRSLGGYRGGRTDKGSSSTGSER